MLTVTTETKYLRKVIEGKLILAQSQRVQAVVGEARLSHHGGDGGMIRGIFKGMPGNLLPLTRLHLLRAHSQMSFLMDSSTNEDCTFCCSVNSSQHYQRGPNLSGVIKKGRSGLLAPAIIPNDKPYLRVGSGGKNCELCFFFFSFLRQILTV